VSACCNSWYLTPLNIPKVCLNLTAVKSKNGTQSKLHCTEDNQEHLSYAGGLTIDLNEQSVFSDLSAIFMVLCNVSCKRVKGWTFLENFLCMRSRLEAHILVMPEWCPKLLAFIICREVVSFICPLREDKCFMEVSVLAIISPGTLEDWSCWMLGWYCIIIFVHFVAGFELGFYYFNLRLDKLHFNLLALMIYSTSILTRKRLKLDHILEIRKNGLSILFKSSFTVNYFVYTSHSGFG